MIALVPMNHSDKLARQGFNCKFAIEESFWIVKLFFMNIIWYLVAKEEEEEEPYDTFQLI